MVQWFIESLLVDRLGVTRNALEGFRSHSLKKGVDWKKENRHVVLSDEAVKKILLQLGSPDLDYSGCAQKNGAPQNDELVELVVDRVFPNPCLIRATNPDTGELVLVRVPKNTNFRPRMVVKVRTPGPPPAPQLYRLEGRCPRFPGRW